MGFTVYSTKFWCCNEFLKGSKLDYITENEEPIIEAHFPNSKIVEIKNAGHWLHAENPKQFYAEVCGFFGVIR